MNVKQMCDWACGDVHNSKNLDTALLVFRLVLGFAFVYHGWGKIMMPDAFVGFFASIGLSYFWLMVAAYAELLGGLAIILGVMTRLAGYVLAIVMVVAIWLVHLDKGYSMMNNGYEYQLLLLASVLLLAMVGPGKMSVHDKYCKH